MREIVRAAHDPDVGLVVVGAHDLPDSAGPGHVARGIAMRLRGPLLVVPAKAVVPARLERLLVPLEGTEATTAPIRALLERFPFGPETELVTLHVFTQDDMPPFANHAPHEADAWVHEFRDRYVPAGTPQATHREAISVRSNKSSRKSRHHQRNADRRVMVAGFAPNHA